MVETPNWVDKTVVCPDCGATVNFRMDYTSHGWMEEGGYKECYCWPPDHQVHQPMYLDRRTDQTKIDCPKENKGG